jgi:hypothetical protein
MDTKRLKVWHIIKNIYFADSQPLQFDAIFKNELVLHVLWLNKFPSYPVRSITLCKHRENSQNTHINW